jgi:uncharacterized repeat protein (TIGR03847 family)
MSDSYELPTLDSITVGTIGEPGHRLFFLQARQGTEVVTLKMEKVQVAALASWIVKTLEDLPGPGPLPEDMEPEPFDEPSWAVGSLGGGYDADADRIVLVAGELTDEDEGQEGEEGEEGEEEAALAPGRGARARLSATREQMAALAIRGTTLVSTGRPPCPLCGYPLDPSGHMCPKTNGHRPPNL